MGCLTNSDHWSGLGGFGPRNDPGAAATLTPTRRRRGDWETTGSSRTALGEFSGN